MREIVEKTALLIVGLAILIVMWWFLHEILPITTSLIVLIGLLSGGYLVVGVGADYAALKQREMIGGARFKR